jgi:hypothetical protein
VELEVELEVVDSDEVPDEESPPQAASAAAIPPPSSAALSRIDIEAGT